MRNSRHHYGLTKIDRLFVVVVLLVFPSLLMPSARAQQNAIVYPEAFYGSINVGGGLSNAGSGMKPNIPAVDLAVGYWISRPLAFQLDFFGMLGENRAGESSYLLSANAEFKWDINSTFFHVYNENFLKPIPFYPIFGLGALLQMSSTSDNTDHSIQAMVGLQMPVRIGQRLDAILQYKCYYLPQWEEPASHFIHVLGVGLLYSQHADPFHRRPEYESRGKSEDWFIGFGIGPNYSAFEIVTNPNRGGLGMIGVAPEIMVGRNFSNFWGVRAELTGLVAHEPYNTVLEVAGDSYLMTYAHFDLLLNMSYLLHFRRGVKWNVLPYLGAGAAWRYSNGFVDMGVDAGLMLRRYLGLHSDVFADLKYVMLPTGVPGSAGPSEKFYGVGLPSLTVGYIYNFGHSSTRYRLPYKCSD